MYYSRNPLVTYIGKCYCYGQVGGYCHVYPAGIGPAVTGRVRCGSHTPAPTTRCLPRPSDPASRTRRWVSTWVCWLWMGEISKLSVSSCSLSWLLDHSYCLICFHICESYLPFLFFFSSSILFCLHLSLYPFIHPFCPIFLFIPSNV